MTYRCHSGLDQDKLPVSVSGLRDGALYDEIGKALDVSTHQVRVVYVGVGGDDNGRLYICSQVTWAEKFTKEQSDAGVISQEG